MAAAWVYMLRCSDGTLYTGSTLDLRSRIRAHCHGTASKYTRSRRPVKLVYAEPQDSWSAALSREHAVKSLPRERKLALIEASPRSRSS